MGPGQVSPVALMLLAEAGGGGVSNNNNNNNPPQETEPYELELESWMLLLAASRMLRFG